MHLNVRKSKSILLRAIIPSHNVSKTSSGAV
jgi:hypothetical protein